MAIDADILVTGAIKTGIEYLRDNEDAFRGLFEDYPVKTVDGMWLRWQAINPLVVEGYAKAQVRFPLIAVILLGEKEEQGFEGQMTDGYGVLLAQEVGVFEYAMQPMDLRMLHVAVQASILGARETFIQSEIAAMEYVDGGDVEPVPELMPPGALVRRQVWKFTGIRRSYQVIEESSLKNIFVWMNDIRVGDIHGKVTPEGG